MAFVICCSIVCFSELQMKNKSPLSAPCINYCSNSRKNRSLLMGANGSNFGLLPFVAVSLKSSGKLNTGGLAGNEYASDTCLNAGRQFISSSLPLITRNQKIYLVLSLRTLFFISLPFLKTIDCLLSHIRS